MEYHVLSNSDMITILIIGSFSAIALLPLFSYFAKRDASPNDVKKGLFRKIIPWVIFCIFLSDIFVLIYRATEYPWSIEPQPSNASIYREIRYLGSDHPLWGWANDYQLPFLTTFAGCILWYCWTIYAFNFKRSDTSWWKKICKGIAYFIISVVILGFTFHEFRDIWVYIVIIVVVALLLGLAKVRPAKNLVNTQIKEEKNPIQNNSSAERIKSNEDPSRFMPPSSKSNQKEVTESSSEDPNFSQSIVDLDSQEKHKTILEAEHQKVEPALKVIDNFQEEPPIGNLNSSDMMFCRFCGKKIEADSKFCKFCGRKQ